MMALQGSWKSDKENVSKTAHGPCNSGVEPVLTSGAGSGLLTKHSESDSDRMSYEN